MAEKIKITAGGVEMTATLVESDAARALVEALPIESKAERWGDEIYFRIPLEREGEDLQAKVPSGTIAYWPPGNAFCIFFGQTPYSPVEVLGKVDGDEKEFAEVAEAASVRLEKA
jgi:hypothetical protein